jgi:hypothetical protein
MKGIIDQIVNVMPGAVTQFDKYGNAIAISTARVREYIVAEKARLQVVNADAIDENQKRLDEINKRIAFQKQDIDAIAKKGTFDVCGIIKRWYRWCKFINKKSNTRRKLRQKKIYIKIYCSNN